MKKITVVVIVWIAVGLELKQIEALSKLTGEKVKIKKVDMPEGCNCYVNHYGKIGTGIEIRLDCPVHGK